MRISWNTRSRQSRQGQPSTVPWEGTQLDAVLAGARSCSALSSAAIRKPAAMKGKKDASRVVLRLGLVFLCCITNASGVQIWAEYAQSLPVPGITATDAYQLKINGVGTTGLFDYLHLTASQAVTLRHQLFDFILTRGLGVDNALYNETDPAKEQVVDLVPDTATKTGYKLAPSLAVVDSIGFIGPYYRNKTRYPSVVFPNTGDPDVDSRVYSFFEAGYTLVTLKPVSIPSIGTLDLGSSILNAIIRFVNLDAPLGKQAFEITTPLLRTPQPGLTVDGLLGVAGLGDGANDVGNGEALVVSNGTEVGPALWVTRNVAFFAVPSVAAAGFTPADLASGMFPGYKFSTAGYNESFTSFGS